ncbi:hypothetical protein PbB2_00105 [Candidatus Phycosocius bacilliformis]|uniref:Uncharacterized protein n=1 Tax=Candidatus Phycosocius bacilliformis TaxID=1445552 RepID=A0A2P2E5X4_9PROT|nr:hypothetical protein [Candidatus Phycosocius bacilliformis]GBF56449.1 hypothetical protein PbB2_00105 [Candidatus Phycosocius bacilliformis]
MSLVSLGIDGALHEQESPGIIYPIQSIHPRFMDLLGRLKTTLHQNIYDADFEYGPQPLRWESLTLNGGAQLHLPQEGGVRLSVPTTANAVSIRQSRPYHRYQPGKTMLMASFVLMDPAVVGNRQRCGFFDDTNGVFFEQGDPDLTPRPNNLGPRNPSGMSVVRRTDNDGTIQEERVPLQDWSGNKDIIYKLNWDRPQMIWIAYTYYGGGSVQYGCYLEGQPHILHEIHWGNRANVIRPWARTGNLPVRYETRNINATSVGSSMVHYGVSVIVDGGIDEQRGGTYSYGMALQTPRRTVSANTIRFPVLSIRMRTMGTLEYTQATQPLTAGTTGSATVGAASWATDQWRGRHFNYFVGGVSYMGRITGNNATTLTLVDPITGGPLAVAPVAGQPFTIGLINRGQLLPRRLMLASDGLAQLEFILSTPSSPVLLTGANFQPLAQLGSPNSFAERDVSATAYVSGGEVVKASPLPFGGSGLQELSLAELFPLYTNIRGTVTDTLTLAVTTQAGQAANVGATFDAQEAMS